MIAAEKICKDIALLFHNYHSFDPNFSFTESHVMEWVSQFDENDREFILTEFFHILKKGVYVSEDKARQILMYRLEKVSTFYKFKNVPDFLKNANFLKLQDEHKSQCDLLKLLDNELLKNYGIGLNQCGTESKKYAVYIDDIIASGKTLYDTLEKWLSIENENGSMNSESLIKGNTLLCIIVFCTHNWNKAIWRLGKHFESDNISKNTRLESYFVIQNNRSFLNQTLNFAFPLNNNDKMVIDFLTGLKATENGNYAFRKTGTPANEQFFSTPQNRIRLETIFLNKGIEILQHAKILEDNQRPLGMTPPQYKILGTGTLFFTWRNISNTCPVVFWWKSNFWKPLFPLKNRG